MYSKNISYFKPVDIKLLRSLSVIWLQYFGEGVPSDSGIIKGEICQMLRTPANYSVGKFGSNGCGTSYYEISEKLKFIEGEDFVFV